MANQVRLFFRRHGTGYLFLLPFLFLFTLFIIIPVIVAFGISFTNYNMLQPPQWVGITNYKLLFMDDRIFLKALQITMVFAFITGPSVTSCPSLQHGSSIY